MLSVVYLVILNVELDQTGLKYKRKVNVTLSLVVYSMNVFVNGVR